MTSSVNLSDIATRLRRSESFQGFTPSIASQVYVPENVLPLVLGAWVQEEPTGSFLVGVPTSSDADKLVNALRAFCKHDRVFHFPAWETLPFERVSPSIEIVGRRQQVIWELTNSVDQAIVVASSRALTQKVALQSPLSEPITLLPGTTPQVGGLHELVSHLVAMGYTREYQVEHRGEVALRGGIVDVFPSLGSYPIRVEFFGDDVDRLTTFNANDQRSTADIDAVTIYAARELAITDHIKARAGELIELCPWGKMRWELVEQGVFFDGMESWLPWLQPEAGLISDLFPEGSSGVFVDLDRITARSMEIIDEENSLAKALAPTWGIPDDGVNFPTLHVPVDQISFKSSGSLGLVSRTPRADGRSIVSATQWNFLDLGDSNKIVERLSELVDKKYLVLICASGRGSKARIYQNLTSAGLVVEVLDEPVELDSTRSEEAPAKRAGLKAEDVGTYLRTATAKICIVELALEDGFILDQHHLAVISENDLTGRHRVHKTIASAKPGRSRSESSTTYGFFDDLSPGDYVVHQHHGVGKFSGMVRRSLGGAEKDYLLVEYRGNDKLYVPSDQMDLLSRYSGGDSPSLHRLGGSEFQKTKAKVRKEIEKIAQELVVLYSKRLAQPGFQFSPDTVWQGELEDSFSFVETPDQLKAVAQVKSDMESTRPMDRIVCGDVGFGKTEVAIRAAFKAVQDGKQVAVLVPTTLLAQQHYETFSDRMAQFPVSIEVLSRFLTAQQAKKVTNSLATGEADLVIGTHRLLSGDIEFKNLGLLVVDEEQRFGVNHKEAIKKLATNVDVLTLTASPIPRTLEMGLTGIRDITILSTPPVERQPILTYVGPLEEPVIVEAIRRELLREGQVFYVHNLVRDIQACANRLRELVPEARVVVAHGQMDEGTLERVVVDFADGKYDVLCCTTIIESGIDMPTVNTLVVDRADRLGLGQLHQLRGRVGRSGARAYAYLLYPPQVSLTETAYERLKTIGDNVELGSGLRIAMRDLEIRGAGNLLGRDQSGQISAVGYDMYVSMVSDALSELKGEVTERQVEIKLELPVDAYIPESYISRDDLRIEAYRQLASVRTNSELDEIVAEWTDRYGKIPGKARSLLDVTRLRVFCMTNAIDEIVVTPGRPGGPNGGKTLAKISPIMLKASGRVRLSRLFPDASAREAPRQHGPGLSQQEDQSTTEAPITLALPIDGSVADLPEYLIKSLASLLGLD